PAAVMPAITDQLHALLVARADALMGCPEESSGACELEAITDAIEAYEAVRWPHGKMSEVDPVSWIPDSLRFGSPRCARSAHTMRRSSGGRWSSWFGPAGRQLSWRMSSSRRPSRSTNGLPKPTATRAAGLTA